MQIRIAPSLGALEGHPNDIWGTDNPIRLNPIEPAVFFGVYGLPDFYELWRHRGEKHILWAGSDIRHFINGYWLDSVGEIRLAPSGLAEWINKYCTSWVENQVEQKALASKGIESTIVPSFLGRIEDFPLCYKHKGRVDLYTSVSGDDFELYGWHRIVDLAQRNPDVLFHLYGNTVPAIRYFGTMEPNMIDHGRVPKDIMNADIKFMTGALRLTEFDGFSEILAKSILMGQYPVSLIPYPYMRQPHEIKTLKYLTEPNEVGREFYIRNLNRYPWNLK